MRTIARLFGKSPFAPLQTHMNRVNNCMEKLAEILTVLPKLDSDKIEKMVADLCYLEHEADLTKNDIRNHLPKSLFIPIDREHFLDILSIQDTIADQTEEIGTALTFYSLEEISSLQKEFHTLFEKSAATFTASKEIIREIDHLLQSSFGGIEAEKVKTMVEQTAFHEYECRMFQRELMKKFFHEGKHFSSPSFYLGFKLIENIGLISKLSEKLANRIRMILELK